MVEELELLYQDRFFHTGILSTLGENEQRIVLRFHHEIPNIVVYAKEGVGGVKMFGTHHPEFNFKSARKK